MEKFKVILKEDAQGAILTATDVVLAINGTYPMPGGVPTIGNLDVTNFRIEAKLTSVLRDGTNQTTTMPTMSIIGDELEKQILVLPDGNEKTKAQAKLANFDKCNTTIRAAITKLMKDQYILENTTV
ncbi:hypothetical protein [Pedobacter cryoconitis]|uniref:Uncharacterized protein n=1 Tax=Pedobacter cryoconitis TaxID=188932 RepID=A0A327SK58_9SPHI|nr:hypothetical protein [Pedobacter cryoconitis]RAJ28862.1 hypothetical protein LY11_03136 [Pedobacter cryoconitis]